MGEGDGDKDDGADLLREGWFQSRRGHHFREQRVKFPKQRRILRPGEVFSLAGFLPNSCSLGFSIRVNSHVNFICAMQDICDVIQ
ncbi:hypothetical protein SFRURICE_004184 [Spodoptera frugiperda]|nr:hypothetical protein SFRURICE_004184 [Spodoptera frugiperda]